MREKKAKEKSTPRWLVFGARGFLGSRIVHELVADDAEVVGTCRSDVSSEDARHVRYSFPEDDLSEIVSDRPFDFIIMAARFANPSTFGSGALGEFESAMRHLCGKCASLCNAGKDSCVTYVSSDAVFSGSNGPYAEADAPDPDTEYGKYQLSAERIVQENCPNHLIVRMSYIYAERDLQSDKRLRRLQQAVQADAAFQAEKALIKSPVAVEAAANSIVGAMRSGRRGILHVPAPPVSIYDFYAAGLQRLGVPEKQALLVSSPDAPARNTSLVSHVNNH